jgi:DNA-directed RNA polymerase subunit RPC12/RpoP
VVGLGHDCPKCQSRMQPGFLAYPADASGLGGRQVVWHPGEPKREQVSFLGVEVSQSWEVRVDPDLLEPVTQYRCTGCGYIESYAH